jgi:hypothetical protein
VKKHLQLDGLPSNGVYVAHDSMGYARYIGRGDIFTRLKARKKAQRLELSYFSFYVVLEKTHEREIESLLIRAAGPLLEFNNRKRRENIQAADTRDFEAGTQFYERQYKRGRQVKAPRGRPRQTGRPRGLTHRSRRRSARFPLFVQRAWTASRQLQFAPAEHVLSRGNCRAASPLPPGGGSRLSGRTLGRRIRHAQ